MTSVEAPGARHVLVIDDEPHLRKIIQFALEDEGYIVQTAVDGEAGLRAIDQVRPDVIVIDLNMPRLSGWDVIERLKAYPTPPPVIAMSGSGEDMDRLGKMAAAKGMVRAYLAKPFRVLDLVAACEQVLVPGGGKIG